MKPEEVVRFYKFIVDAYDKENIDAIVDYLDELEKCLLYLDKEYGKGKKTPLSDSEYDKLYSIFFAIKHKDITGDDSATDKVEHDYPNLKGTVAKVHYISYNEKKNDPYALQTYHILEDWVIKSWSNISVTSEDKVLAFYPKFDGMSVVLSLDENRNVTKAVTRGDMDEGVGQDKTELFQHVNFSDAIPSKFDGEKVGLKIEAIVTHEDYKEYNKRCCGGLLADERAAAASLLNSKEFTEVHKKYLSFVPLMIECNGHMYAYRIDDKEFDNELINYGPMYEMIVQNHLPFNLGECLTDIITQCKKMIDDLPVNCDGIVIRWADQHSMDDLGRHESRPINNFEIAYKFPKANNYTKITDIIQDIGVLGAVSYTAEFEPFNFNGRTIKRASLGSYDRAKALNLAVGDTVNVKYEIIPYLMVDEYCEAHRSGNPPIQLITKCPYCHNKLNFDPVPHCDNLECECRLMGKILNFCEGMRIKHIGESMIEDLFHAGYIHDIRDLFEIENNKSKIKKLDGFGDSKLDNIIKQLNKLNVPDYRLLGSIGIQNLRAKRAKMILDIYYISDVLEMAKDPEANRQKLLKIRGLGEKFVDKVLKGVDENRELIEFLLKRVKVTHDGKSKEALGYVVFTGFRNPDFEKHLEKGGIIIQNSVTKDTSFVIAKNPDANSSKILKAKEKGVQVIGVEDAYVRFNYKY